MPEIVHLPSSPSLTPNSAKFPKSYFPAWNCLHVSAKLSKSYTVAWNRFLPSSPFITLQPGIVSLPSSTSLIPQPGTVYLQNSPSLFAKLYMSNPTTWNSSFAKLSWSCPLFWNSLFSNLTYKPTCPSLTFRTLDLPSSPINHPALA